MKTSILFDTEMNNIIFENRNKSFGAYTLRNTYERNMTRSMLSGILLFLCCISSPLVYNYFTDRNHPDLDIVLRSGEMNLSTFKKEVLPVPKVITPKVIKPPLKNQIKFIPPTVVPDEEVVEKDDVPTTERLAENTIGQTNIDGEENKDIPAAIEEGGQEYTSLTTAVEPAVFNSFAVQQQPEFPDGMAAMYKFLEKHLNYPELAIDNGLSGTVHVQFVVSKEGVIEDVIVRRGIGSGLDEEAIRVIRLMPRWNPGKHNGRPVAVIYTLPIKFQLLK